MKANLHKECFARSCREIEELKRRCCQEGNYKKTTTKIGRISTQHDQESRTVSLFRDKVRKLQQRFEFIEGSNIFQDLDSPSSFGSAHVSQQPLITSSSRKPSREPEMPRNTRENMSVPGNVFGRRHSRNLATFCRFQEQKELRIVGARNHCNQYFYFAFQ